MKITYDNNKMTKLDYIETGEVFLYKNDIYMKLPDIYDNDYDFNCIILSIGDLSHIDKNSLVFKVDAELIIK